MSPAVQRFGFDIFPEWDY
jgi:hypothetical protein